MKDAENQIVLFSENNISSEKKEEEEGENNKIKAVVRFP
jgi:hypothetical protein